MLDVYGRYLAAHDEYDAADRQHHRSRTCACGDEKPPNAFYGVFCPACERAIPPALRKELRSATGVRWVRLVVEALPAVIAKRQPTLFRKR